MRFVIIGTAYPLRGGIAQYVGLLYKALVDRGHDAKIITFSRQYPKILFPGKFQEEQGSPGVAVESLQVIDSLNPLTWREAGKRAAEFEPDAIIFKFWLPFFAPAYGLIARTAKKILRKKGKNVKIIFIADNVIPHEKRPLDRELTNYAFKVVDHFIVQSSAVERDLKIVKPDAKYLRLEHPVFESFGAAISREHARKQLGLPDSAEVLLYFGFIRKYKGIDIAIRAVAQAAKTRPNLLLVIAGESYSGEEDYKALAKQLGLLDTNVKFFDQYISNDDVSLYFSSANAALLPYRSATQSGVVQIAYNYDLPVIATNVGGLPEIVVDGKSGLIASEATPESVAEAIEKYFNGSLESTLRAGVRAEKPKYTWATFVEGIERISRS
ncbi:MAG TPA: glycosyltransferase, partial [Candidatus Kapabacteria bacterium]|nr:glycosyltransferase [Candidatus Kapabacteria bacterium]